MLHYMRYMDTHTHGQIEPGDPDNSHPLLLCLGHVIDPSYKRVVLYTMKLAQPCTS
jgi:hypothetical protein